MLPNESLRRTGPSEALQLTSAAGRPSVSLWRSQLNAGRLAALGEIVATMNFQRVDVRGNQIGVHHRSAIDNSACAETIDSNDVVRIVLERVAGHVHWFLQHRAGWTLHFHDGFENAA